MLYAGGLLGGVGFCLLCFGLFSLIFLPALQAQPGCSVWVTSRVGWRNTKVQLPLALGCVPVGAVWRGRAASHPRTRRVPVPGVFCLGSHCGWLRADFCQQAGAETHGRTRRVPELRLDHRCHQAHRPSGFLYIRLCVICAALGFHEWFCWQ